MLSVMGVLPEHIVRALLRFNIRYVEQFLEMALRQTTAPSLAEALDLTPEELQSLASSIKATHADLTVPEYSGNDYGLGYGKKRDWEKLQSETTTPVELKGL